MILVINNHPTRNVGCAMLRSTNARANAMAATIVLGSSGEDDDNRDNFNDNDNKNRNSATHMSGTDLGDRDARLSGRFHAPIGKYTC
jgi:hypothetical protein